MSRASSLVLLLSLLVAGALYGSVRPVSPGRDASATAVAAGCPLLTWAGPSQPEASNRLEIEVRRLDELEAWPDGTLLARIEVPASARSWTPPAAACPPGVGLAWSVRVVGEPAWARPLRFRTVDHGVSHGNESPAPAGGIHTRNPTGGEPRPSRPERARARVPRSEPSFRGSSNGLGALIVANPGAGTGVVFGLHARSVGSVDGSAGLVAEGESTAGDVAVVRAVAGSPLGAVAAFQNPAGGAVLVGERAGVEVFRVDSDATVTATAFVGDASRVFDVGDVECDGCIDAAELGTVSVVTGNLVADAVTAQKLAIGAVTSSRLAAGAVTSAKLGTDAVTTTKLADDAVTTTVLADGAIGGAELASGAVQTGHVPIGAVTLNKIHFNLFWWSEEAYSRHADCTKPGSLSRNHSCDSRECSSGFFYDCRGICGMPFAVSCSNQAVGYFIDLDQDF